MSQHSALRRLSQTAMMLALLIVLGLLPAIPLGFIPVPLVLQNMGVMLAGSLLGARGGTTAVALLLFLVACGLPFLSGGRGGAAMFVGATAGYMYGWLFVPGLLRLFMGRKPRSWGYEWLVMILVGVLFVDAAGSIWLAMQTHMPLGGAFASNLVFIPGDILKATLVVAISRRLRRGVHQSWQ